MYLHNYSLDFSSIWILFVKLILKIYEIPLDSAWDFWISKRDGWRRKTTRNNRLPNKHINLMNFKLNMKLRYHKDVNLDNLKSINGYWRDFMDEIFVSNYKLKLKLISFRSFDEIASWVYLFEFFFAQIIRYLLPGKFYSGVIMRSLGIERKTFF